MTTAAVLSTLHYGGSTIWSMAVGFPDALRRFDAHLQAIGRAPKTRATYRYELTRFWCDHCALEDLEPLEAGVDDVEEYLASLPHRGSKRSDASRALKAFYAWAAPRMGSNPASGVVIPRGRLSAAPHLAVADARALLRAAFHREPRRGWAIALCLATGARVGSLVAVKACDVDIQRAWINFRVTKGDRPYGVPLNRMGLCAARHLLASQARASDFGPSDEVAKSAPLTLIGVGAPGFRVWVHEAQRDAGLDRVWPHLLRHEFSNRVAAKGDPEAWRRAMNHADLSQWSRYVAVSDERIRGAVS